MIADYRPQIQYSTVISLLVLHSRVQLCSYATGQASQIPSGTCLKSKKQVIDSFSENQKQITENRNISKVTRSFVFHHTRHTRCQCHRIKKRFFFKIPDINVHYGYLCIVIHGRMTAWLWILFILLFTRGVAENFQTISLKGDLKIT